MVHIVIDIETRRDSIWLSSEGVEDALRASIRAPGNYKKIEAIESHREEAFAKMLSRAALKPLTGRIVAIGLGCLDDDDSPFVFWDDNDERKLLAEFANWIISQRDVIVWCGWRVRNFDIPYITARAAINNVSLPGNWPTRRWDNRIIDLAETLDPDHETHLDTWLMRCGLPLKTAHGSDVETMPIDQVANYCGDDVVRERRLLRRFQASVPSLRPREESITARIWDDENY